CIGKWGNMKRRRKVREMMLDPMKGSSEPLAWDCLFHKGWNILAILANLKTFKEQPRVWSIGRDVFNFTKEICAAVLIDCDMIDVGKRDPRLPKAKHHGFE